MTVQQLIDQLSKLNPNLEINFMCEIEGDSYKCAMDCEVGIQVFGGEALFVVAGEQYDEGDE